MSKPDTFADTLQSMSQEQKDAAVYRAIDMGGDDVLRALIRHGARTSYPDNPITDVLPWALHKTEELSMVQLLLEEGVSAQNIAFKDMKPFFRDYSSEEVWLLLAQMAKADMPLYERAKACVYGAGNNMDVTGLMNMATDEGARYIDFVEQENRIRKDDYDLAAMRTQTEETLHASIAKKLEPRYWEHFREGITSAALKETLNDDGMTGFMLAVKAGHIREAVTALELTGPKSFDPAEILRRDAYGQNVFSMVARRNELEELFSPKIWATHTPALLEMLESIPVAFVKDVDAKALILQACDEGVRHLNAVPAKKLNLRKPQA